MSEIIEILKAEQKRIAGMLPTLDPTTGEYKIAVDNLASVGWKLNELEHCDDGATPAPTPVKLDPMEEPTPMAEEPKEEPKEEPATEAETETDWGAYRLALRERMADARIGGLDTKALLAKVGASKFSTIPDEELPALAAALDEALKEKA